MVAGLVCISARSPCWIYAMLTTNRRSSVKKQGSYSQGMEKEHALYFMLNFRTFQQSRKASLVTLTPLTAAASVPRPKRQYWYRLLLFLWMAMEQKSQLFFLYTICVNYLTLYLAPEEEIEAISKQGSKYYRSTSSLVHRGIFRSVVQVIMLTAKRTHSDRPDSAETHPRLSYCSAHILE